ncbi:MAG: VWA-like domain-containing protein [Lachnospiraceae bacterium]
MTVWNKIWEKYRDFEPYYACVLQPLIPLADEEEKFLCSTDGKYLFYHPKRLEVVWKHPKNWSWMVASLNHLALHLLQGDIATAARGVVDTDLFNLAAELSVDRQQNGIPNRSGKLQEFLKKTEALQPYLSTAEWYKLLDEWNVDGALQPRENFKEIQMDDHSCWYRMRLSARQQEAGGNGTHSPQPNHMQQQKGLVEKKQQDEQQKEENDKNKTKQNSRDTRDNKEQHYYEKNRQEQRRQPNDGLLDCRQGANDSDQTEQLRCAKTPPKNFYDVMRQHLRWVEAENKAEEIDYRLYGYAQELYGDTLLCEPPEEGLEQVIRRIAIAIDVSGSCSDCYPEFLKDVFDFLQKAEETELKLELYLLFIDTRIQKEVLIQSFTDFEKILKEKITGFGGTDFCPLQEWSNALDVPLEALFVFTDGFADFPETAPDYKYYLVMRPEDIDDIENASYMDLPAYAEILKLEEETCV